MSDDLGAVPRECPWTLVLGPGPALARLAAWLRAHPAEPAGGTPKSVEQLDDWCELYSTFPDNGRLLVDADALAASDRGRIEDFLDAHRAWRLHLCGSDPTGAAARRLLDAERARWTPWPPDLLELEGLLRTPASPSLQGATAPEQRPAQAREEAGPDASGETNDPARTDATPPLGSGTSGRLDPRMREEIEAILECPGTPSDAAPHSPAELTEPAGQAGPAGQTEPAGQAEPADPAPFFRAQVADLADIAQRLHFSLARCRPLPDSDSADAPAAPDAAAFDDLEAELLHLEQFTRTLGYTAAPPACGKQTLDLERLLEEQLASLTAVEPRPTTHLATGEALPVAADKALLAQALDALLFLALSTTGADGTLRIEAAADGPRARVILAFPAGPLAGLEPAVILEPYGVSALLPELGPNALAAARGIIRGQGGSLTLSTGPEEHLIWLLELPLAK